ncbi:MAG: ABC transporter permease [Pseudomonadales bacterium]|jgi:phospholipid/cholesterol/gamma-HCH transport system permease protein|nr:ABC transporter permease [Pseudomonadales bacterium]
MTAAAVPEPTLVPESGRLLCAGAWTLAHAPRLQALVAAQRVRGPAGDVTLDGAGIETLDTAGALLLLELLGDGGAAEAERVEGLSEADAALVRLVAAGRHRERPRPERRASLVLVLERMGEAVIGFWRLAIGFLGFVGLVVTAFAALLVGRRRLRLTSTVFHMEQIGLDAVPIVALLTFLVGAVVAFVGATALRDLGAEVFTVELVSISFLREFGVLLVAILLAGRSGSAFAAEIGSMKSREELDAIDALGLDAVELLVLPRLLALLVMLPVLTVVGMLAGILGGAVVSVLALDMTSAMFLSRLQEETALRHFFVGMAKAPVFAFLVGTVGCLEGFRVTGSAESVGRHTTSSVVQAIFLVIVADALFAMCLMEIGL